MQSCRKLSSTPLFDVFYEYPSTSEDNPGVLNITACLKTRRSNSELPAVDEISSWRGGVGEAGLFHLPVNAELKFSPFLGCRCLFLFSFWTESPNGHARHWVKFSSCARNGQSIFVTQKWSLPPHALSTGHVLLAMLSMHGPIDNFRLAGWLRCGPLISIKPHLFGGSCLFSEFSSALDIVKAIIKFIVASLLCLGLGLSLGIGTNVLKEGPGVVLEVVETDLYLRGSCEQRFGSAPAAG